MPAGGGRSEHAVVTARKTRRRPATPRGVGGPTRVLRTISRSGVFPACGAGRRRPACSRRNVGKLWNRALPRATDLGALMALHQTEVLAVPRRAETFSRRIWP